MQPKIIATTLCLAGSIAAAETEPNLSIGFRVDAPPFVYVAEAGKSDQSSEMEIEYEGFAADICYEVLADMRASAPAPLEIETFPVTAADRFQTENGEERAFDMLCDTTSITLPRLEHCTFSFPYFVTGISFATPNAMMRLRDVQGAKIGLVGGTTAVERLDSEWQRRFGERPDVMPFEDYEQGVKAAQSGVVDAIFGDQVLLEQANADLEAGLRLSNEVLSTELYGLCVNPDRPDVLRKVNETLAGLYSSGQIYAMVNKHFENRGASRLLVMLYAFYAVPEN